MIKSAAVLLLVAPQATARLHGLKVSTGCAIILNCVAKRNIETSSRESFFLRSRSSIPVNQYEVATTFRQLTQAFRSHSASSASIPRRPIRPMSNVVFLVRLLSPILHTILPHGRIHDTGWRLMNTLAIPTASPLASTSVSRWKDASNIWLGS